MPPVRLMTRSLMLTVVACSTLMALPGCGGPRALPAVKDSGEFNLRNGRFDEALGDFKEYIDRSPGRADVHYLLGKTYLARGESAFAVEQMHVARSIRMEDDEIFAGLCEALYADKQLDELNRTLRARTVDRGRMQDWALLAQYAEKLGDRDEVQRGWLTAAQVDQGQSALPQLGLARLYLSVGDIAQAKRRAAMAYYIDPLNAEINELVKQLNEIPGPTFGIPPAELPGNQTPTATPGV